MAIANLTDSVRKILEMSGVLKLIPEVKLTKESSKNKQYSNIEEESEEKII